MVTTGARVSRTITTRSPFGNVARVTFEACSGLGFAKFSGAHNINATAQIMSVNRVRFGVQADAWKERVRNMDFPLNVSVSGHGH